MSLWISRDAFPGKEWMEACGDMAIMHMSRTHRGELAQHIHPHESDKLIICKCAVTFIHNRMTEMPILTPIYSNWLVLLFIIRENGSLFRNVSWKPGEWYQCTWSLDCLNCSSGDLWGEVMNLPFHGGAGWCERQLMLSEEAGSSAHGLPLSRVPFAAAE